jgi:hypothetical protein
MIMSDPMLTARTDQLSAFTNSHLDDLLVVIPAGDSRRGEAQNMADFVALLSGEEAREYLAALVVTAVRRIARLS